MKTGEAVASAWHVEERLREFVHEHGLEDKKVLDIGSPLRFHYNRLVPNYDKYWQGDSDAVSSMDRYEALLWFASR